MSIKYFQPIKKGNNHAYLLRIIDADVVERENNSLDDSEAQTKEQEDNNQIMIILCYLYRD